MSKIHKLIRLLSIMVLSIASLSYALEVKDISLPMTRNEADNKLSKDYSFTVLEDASLRRSWSLKDKTVHMDFNLSKGNAICVIVEYKSPVSLDTARKDIAAMTGADSKLKLRKVNKELAGMGFKGCIGNKVGKSWVFAQPGSKNKKKCGRVLVFAQKPTKNRLELSTATEGGDNYTAMGSSGRGIDISAITAAEEARRNSKPSTAIASAPSTTGKDKTKPGKPIAAAEDDTPAKDQEFEGVETDDGADAFGDEDESFAGGTDTAADSAAEQKGFLPEAISAPVRGLLASTGLSALVVDIIIVAVVALLLLIIFSKISSSRRKKQAKAMYESIVNKPAGSAGNDNNEAK